MRFWFWLSLIGFFLTAGNATPSQASAHLLSAVRSPSMSVARANGVSTAHSAPTHAIISRDTENASPAILTESRSQTVTLAKAPRSPFPGGNGDDSRAIAALLHSGRGQPAVSRLALFSPNGHGALPLRRAALRLSSPRAPPVFL